MKIISIIGARPQFIKAAAVSRVMAKHKIINEKIIHTGQHFDKSMSDVFFKELEIPKPHYHLGIGNLHHGAMTGRMIEAIERILLKENPDFVLVYGDTNSTLAGAIAAKKLHLKLAHVEAGLRSFNMQMPEEINRILTDRISDILFCPTTMAMKNLVKEGFRNFNCKIINSGDVMLDGALHYSKISKKKSRIIKWLNTERYVLCTMHRAENTDNLRRLKSIIAAFNNIQKEKQVIVPVHPKTKKVIHLNKIKIDFLMIDPVGYFDMIELIKNCDLIMTDSGGLQKEAFFFKKACITLREETEWVELVEQGVNIIAGSETKSILNAYRRISRQPMNFNKAFYGKGNAGEKITKYLLSQFKK